MPDKTLLLSNYYNLILHRNNRKIILWVMNIIFAIFISYLFYAICKSASKNINSSVNLIFLASMFLLLFSELFNILNSQANQNLFSRATIKIFPISNFQLFVFIVKKNVIQSRFFLYLLPFLVSVYFAIQKSIFSLFLIAVLFVAVYFFFSLCVSTAEYVYGILKDKFDSVIDKLVGYLFIGIMIILFLFPNITYTFEKFIKQDTMLIKLLSYLFGV